MSYYIVQRREDQSPREGSGQTGGAASKALGDDADRLELTVMDGGDSGVFLSIHFDWSRADAPNTTLSCLMTCWLVAAIRWRTIKKKKKTRLL